MVRRAAVAFWILIFAAPSGSFALAGEPSDRMSRPSFRTEIVPLLTKAGCNQGACHGNQQGKGGFRLSLRGEQPLFDRHSIAGEHGGRRIDPFRAQNSLLLQKATAMVAHQGGARFADGSDAYGLIERWIEQGCPDDDLPQSVRDVRVEPSTAVLGPAVADAQLQVLAEFSDGSQQPVNHLAVFDSLYPEIATVDERGMLRRSRAGEAVILIRYLGVCRTARITFQPDQPAPALATSGQPIDRFVHQKLVEQRVSPSDRCDDAAFVRRIFLDLTGTLPTADEARRFVRDTRPDKRQRIVNDLLARPEAAAFWSLKWADMLRCEELVLDPQGVESFRRYLKSTMAAATPLDTFVYDLLAARGSTYANPPTNFYRAHRTAAQRGETVARLFLGTRLACAQCHNHPFDRWTQDDYYRWVAVFAGIDYEIKDNKRRDDLDKNEFSGEQIVYIKHDAEPIRHPRTGAPMEPKLLGDQRPIDDPSDLAEAAADWLVQSADHRFADTLANWLWKQLLGRGIVEPWDDFRDSNPPSHPELLRYLAQRLVDVDYDWQRLVKEIVASDTYQSGWETTGSPAAPHLFASIALRRMTAEQLLDAQSQVLGVPGTYPGYPLGTHAVDLNGPRRLRGGDQLAPSENLLRAFGRPARLLACDCERSDETSLAQSLLLIGDGSLEERLRDARGNVARWARSSAPPAELVTEMYWTALSRSPTPSELQILEPYVADSTNREESLRDLLWSLINSKEFLFRH